ncbi:MAG: SDR family oxidoreductase, partial [Verrucomicrobiota bacterium]|nr:SDR family oxidoreductase [Verrucomicrobiota bacterium]
EEMMKVNVLGTKQVLKFCEVVSIEHFIFISSTSVYKHRSLEEVKINNIELYPNSTYGKSKLEAEKLVSKFYGSSYIVRMATLFGNGDKYNLYRLSNAIARGKFFIPGIGDTKKSVISIELASQLILRLPFNKTLKSEVINFSIPCSPTFREICHCFSTLHKKKKPKEISFFSSRIIAFICDFLSIFFKLPFNSLILNKLSLHTNVSTYKLKILFPELSNIDFKHYLWESKEYYTSPNNS